MKIRDNVDISSEISYNTSFLFGSLGVPKRPWDSNNRLLDSEDIHCLALVSAGDDLKGYGAERRDRIEDYGYGNGCAYRAIEEACTDFEPLLPVFNAFKHKVLSMKDISDEHKLARLNRFIRRFAFRQFMFSTYRFAPVEVSKITQESEVYYNLLDAKRKPKMLDLVPYTSETGEVGYETDYGSFQIAFEITKLADEEISEVEIRITVDTVPKQLYKDTTISVFALKKWLNTLETNVTAFSTFAKLVVGDKAKIAISYIKPQGWSGCCATYDESKLKAPIFVLDKYGSRARIHPNIGVIGTESELNELREIMNTLNFSAYPTEIIVSEDEVSNQESAVVMSRISTAMSDGKAVAKDYGCFMYLSWCIFSDFYMSKWRGAVGMRDWLLLAGKENVADCLSKIDTYAVVKTNLETILITSGGFLRLAEGTIEKPERVEPVDMDTLCLLCGVFESDKFSKKVFDEFADMANINKLGYQSGYANIVRILNYVYKRCYSSVDDYEIDWTDIPYWKEKAISIAHKYVDNLRDFWPSDADSVEHGFMNAVGYNMHFRGTLVNKITNANFAGTTYNKEGAKDVDDRVIKTMCKIIHLMHSLFNAGDAEVQICDSPLGRKSLAPVLVPLADVRKSPNCVCFPKTKKPEYVKYEQDLLKAYEEAVAKAKKATEAWEENYYKHRR